MTREEILDGLYEIKNWKCNGDAKTHEVVTEAIKALEQGPVIDKIRAEIESKEMIETTSEREFYNMALNDVLHIIDKYKAESEDKKKLSWLGKRCEDCGNKKCKELGELPKGYDCALWQAESEG